MGKLHEPFSSRFGWTVRNRSRRDHLDARYHAQARIARQLRTLYESMPKGGIPDRIWALLLELERKVLVKR